MGAVRLLSSMLLVLASAACSRPAENPTPAPVIVNDTLVITGDTLVTGGNRVRLVGVVAPETGRMCGHAGVKQRCSDIAAAALKAMIAGNPVTCVSEGMDKCGHALSVCYVDGRDINRALVAAGSVAADHHYSQRYVAVEAAPRAGHLGIWGAGYVPHDDSCLPPPPGRATTHHASSPASPVVHSHHGHKGKRCGRGWIAQNKVCHH